MEKSLTTSTDSNAQNIKNELPKNYFKALPNEIFTKIIFFLYSPNERFKCTRVCSAWRNIITGTPSLWSSINFAIGNDPISKAKYWLERLGSENNCFLEEIEIFRFVDWEGGRDPNNFNDLLYLFISSSYIKPSRIKLRSFTFYSHSVEDDPELLHLLMKFICLNQFHLVRLRIVLENKIYVKSSFNSFLNLFPRLKDLSICCVSPNNAFTIQLQLPKKTSPEFLSMRERLQLNTANSSHRSVEGIATPSLPLERLLTKFMQFEEVGEVPLVKLPFLQSVGVCEFKSGPRRRIPTEVWNLPELKWLRLSESSIGPPVPSPKNLFSIPKLELLQVNDNSQFLSDILEPIEFAEGWTPAEIIVNHRARFEDVFLFPNLSTFSGSQVDPEILFKFLALYSVQLNTLETLELKEVRLDATTKPLMMFSLKNLPPLVNLCLEKIHLDDDVLDTVRIGKLKLLNINGSPQVGFNSVARIVDRGLENLKIIGCDLILKEDYLEWISKRVKKQLETRLLLRSVLMRIDERIFELGR